MMIGEFLLHPSFRAKGHFLLGDGVCDVIWVCGGRNNKVVRGVDRNPSEVWSLMRFHVSLWASVLKVFL